MATLQKISWRVVVPSSVPEGGVAEPKCILELLVSDSTAPDGSRLVVMEVGKDQLASLVSNMDAIQNAIASRIKTPAE